MRNSRWLAVLSPVGFLLIWELASRSGVLDPRFFPPPSVILQTLAAMTRSGELPYHVVVSGRRIVLGFLLGAVPAVAVGLAMGLSRPGRSLLMPLVSAIYPIPKIAIYPLIIFYLGLGEASKVSIVALSIFFLVLLNAMAGVFDLARFGVPLVASVAIHAATNLINDYYDPLRGVDTAASIGPSGVIQQGLLAPRAVLLGGLVLFALGGLLGLWLVGVGAAALRVVRAPRGPAADAS